MYLFISKYLRLLIMSFTRINGDYLVVAFENYNNTLELVEDETGTDINDLFTYLLKNIVKNKKGIIGYFNKGKLTIINGIKHDDFSADEINDIILKFIHSIKEKVCIIFEKNFEGKIKSIMSDISHAGAVTTFSKHIYKHTDESSRSLYLEHINNFKFSWG